MGEAALAGIGAGLKEGSEFITTPKEISLGKGEELSPFMRAIGYTPNKVELQLAQQLLLAAQEQFNKDRSFKSIDDYRKWQMSRPHGGSGNRFQNIIDDAALGLSGDDTPSAF